jgi:hypothetical protein
VQASVAESADTPVLELRSPADPDLVGPTAIKKGPVPHPPLRAAPDHEVYGLNKGSKWIAARNCTSLAKRCIKDRLYGLEKGKQMKFNCKYRDPKTKTCVCQKKTLLPTL